jgi:hypothetical protein
VTYITTAMAATGIASDLLAAKLILGDSVRGGWNVNNHQSLAAADPPEPAMT